MVQGMLELTGQREDTGGYYRQKFDMAKKAWEVCALCLFLSSIGWLGWVGRFGWFGWSNFGLIGCRLPHHP